MLVISRHTVVQIFTYFLDLGLESTSLLTDKGPDQLQQPLHQPLASPDKQELGFKVGLKGVSTTGAMVAAATKKLPLRGGILLLINQLCGQYSHALDMKTITSTIQLLKNLKDKGLQLLLV